MHLDSETARDEPGMADKERWNLRLYTGAWQRGVTAGGCRNYAETFHMNPQLQIVIQQAEAVILSLSQHSVTHPQVVILHYYHLNPLRTWLIVFDKEIILIIRSYYWVNQSSLLLFLTAVV